MPGGDRTGPQGLGPQTGRGTGFCAGAGMPGFANRGFGGGYGFGRGGGGRGWRRWFHATGLPGWARWGGGFGWPTTRSAAPGDERAFLEREAAALQDQLDAVRRRLARVGADPATERDQG